MFISMPKINFTIHFFLQMLHFKKSCNLISWQTFGPELENQNSARHGIGGETSKTMLVSILDYFQEKLITKVFSKKPYFGPYLFKFGQKWIFLEIFFRYSNYLPSCQKSEKTIALFLRKMLNWQTHGQTDKETDRQQWFYRTLRRMGSNRHF